jgi:two-component sensor histidine kinase
MSVSGDQPANASASAEEIVASPEVVRAVENDEFRPILDQFPIALALARLDGDVHRIWYANTAFATLINCDTGAILGKDWSLVAEFKHETEKSRTLADAIVAGEDFLGRFTDIQAKKTVEAYAGLIESEDSGQSYSIVALVDVTDRDRSELEKLNQSIADKDMLLRELQHRVRNNLQMVVALIRLEARQHSRGDKVDFDRLARRIDALSILYTSLSERPDDSHIDLAVYIGKIANAVMEGHGPDGVRLELKLESCAVPMRSAMSVGLVVNELITNAFKYAFGENGGVVTVRCERKGTLCVVAVEDDGAGLPPGITWPMPGKIGDLMVKSYRENTRGEFRAVSALGKGVVATLSFEAADAALQ